MDKLLLVIRDIIDLVVIAIPFVVVYILWKRSK